MTLNVSTPDKEGMFQGSRWLKVPFLCDGEELQALFERLEAFFIFPLTGIFDGKPLEKPFFLKTYSTWIEGLQRGEVPNDAALRQLLACAFVRDLDALWLQEIPGKGFLTKIAKPVVQLQAHFFSYSPLDKVFRSMSLGEKSIFWGLQASYPQVYQDGKTMEFIEAKEDPLFRTLRHWMREATSATPFVVEGVRTYAPMRLGKRSFSWIQSHPQLREQKIAVLDPFSEKAHAL